MLNAIHLTTKRDAASGESVTFVIASGCLNLLITLKFRG